MAGANFHYAVQVSDRRLTYRDRTGRLLKYQEGENKAIFWEAPDARLAVAYTGIARIAGQSTEQVLLSLLGEAVEASGYSINPATQYLKRELGRKLSHIPRANRRLTVMCTGFVSTDGMRTVFPANCLITNFQDWETNTDYPYAWDEFTIRYSQPKPDFAGPFSLLQYAGNWTAVRTHEIEGLRPFIEEDRPPEAFVNKTVELFDIWHDRDNGIGSDELTSMVIWTENLDDPTGDYHCKSNSQTIHTFSKVVTRLGFGSLALSNITMTAEDPAPPSVVPRVPGHYPCKCQSGKRYRDCHGRNTQHRRPLIEPDLSNPPDL